MTASRGKWVVVALAFALPLAFAAFTRHAWEDYFITLRASRNLVEGHGLVFTPGERVHSFTSPLGTLLPAVCTALAGPGREEAALWIFRLVNAPALAGGVLLLWRRSRSLCLGPVGRAALFGLLLLDAKLTDFAINGMETALLVFFLLLLWGELEGPEGPRPARLAVAYAGLMWTRPDAFVLAAVVTLARLAFPPPSMSEPLRRPWRRLGRGVVLGGLAYLPWFAWAWWYYGSPVPHTITAKAAVSPAPDLLPTLLIPLRLLVGRITAGDLFLPAYAVFGGWPKALMLGAHGLAVVALFAWPFRIVPGPARRASLALFLGAFYFQSIILFPWYVPPWTVLAVIALSFLLDAGARAIRFPAVVSLARIACLVLVATAGSLWCAVAWQMRVHQRLVETDVRRAIGEWLRANAAPADTVLLEPLGYIGYFSRLKIYDYPGLGSPEVVAAIRSGPADYSSLITRLEPQWLVLRPIEIHHMSFSPLRVLENYQVAKTWSARPALDAVRLLPGRRWCEWESEYVVFRRKVAPAAATASSAAR